MDISDGYKRNWNFWGVIHLCIDTPIFSYTQSHAGQHQMQKMGSLFSVHIANKTTKTCTNPHSKNQAPVIPRPSCHLSGFVYSPLASMRFYLEVLVGFVMFIWPDSEAPVSESRRHSLPCRLSGFCVPGKGVYFGSKLPTSVWSEYSISVHGRPWAPMICYHGRMGTWEVE